MASFTNGFSNMYLEGIDEQRYWPFHSVPGRRFFSPEARLSMHGEGVYAGYTLPPPPKLANSLPRSLWNKPSLIDFDYWTDVNEKLREQGVHLPCDYEFGEYPSTIISGGSSVQTVVQGRASKGGEEDRERDMDGVEIVEGVDGEERSAGVHVPGFGQLLWSYGRMLVGLMGM